MVKCMIRVRIEVDYEVQNFEEETISCQMVQDVME